MAFAACTPTRWAACSTICTASLALLPLVLALLAHPAGAAPVQDNQQHQVAEYYGESGCYYNFQHYEEGDRIITNEPCLNCTCHNRMLMCYLRVCPFTKAIGQDCTIEKKPEQCCPIITCPEVPVQLVTSSTTEPTPPAPSGAGGSTSNTTAVGRPDNYGCTIDSEFYADGAKVPGDPSKPCELCYCIRNRTACVMQECTLNVEGCEPVLADGVCCPIRYECDYQEKPTTAPTTPRPTPGLILATTPGPLDCAYNSDVYSDGEKLPETNPCEFCYCMKGDIVCAVQECGAPLATEGRNCTALPPQPGSCCPQQYLCDNGTLPLDVMNQQKPSGAPDSGASSSSTAAPSDDAPSAAPTPAPTHPPTPATPVEPSLDDNEVDAPGAAAVEAEDDQQQKEPEVSKPIDDSVAESSTTHDHEGSSKPEQPDHNQVESGSGSVDEPQATTAKPEVVQPVEAETEHPDIHVEQSTDPPLQKPESDDHVKPDSPVTPIGEILPTEKPGVIISQDTPSETGESEQAKPSEDTTHQPGFPSNEAVESETGKPQESIEGVTSAAEELHTPAIISQDEEQAHTTAGPSVGEEEQTQEQQTSLPPQEPVVSEGEEQSPLIPTEGSIEKETDIPTTSAPHVSSAKPAEDVPEIPLETTLAPAIDHSQGPALPPQAVESEEQPGTAAPEHHTQAPIEADYVTEQSTADVTTISQQEEEKIPESPEANIPSVPEETQEHVTSSSEQSQEHVPSSSDESQEHVTSSSDDSLEHVTGSSDGLEEHVTSSNEEQEHVTSSNEEQEHVTSSSDQSEEHGPSSSESSPEHEPSSPVESQEHIPTTPDQTQQPLPSPDDSEGSGEPGASSVSEIDHSPDHPSAETTALPIEGDVTTSPPHHEQLPVEAETSTPVEDAQHPTLPSLDDEQNPEVPQKPEESNTIIPESGSETQEQELPSSKPDVQPVEAETSQPDVHIEESTDAPLQKPESDDHVKPETVQPVDITTEQAIGEPAVTSQSEPEAEKPSEEEHVKPEEPSQEEHVEPEEPTQEEHVEPEEPSQEEHVKPEEPSHTTSQPSSFNTEAAEADTGAPDFPIVSTLAPEQPSSADEESSAASQGEDHTQQTEQPSAGQVPAEETDEQQTSRPPVEAVVNEIEQHTEIPTGGSDEIITTSSPHIPAKPADDIPETPIETTLAPETDQSEGATSLPEAVESEGAEAGTLIPDHQTNAPIESDYVTEHPAPEITTVSEQEDDKIPSIPQENVPSIPAETGESVTSSEVEQEGSGDISEATTIGAIHPVFVPQEPEAVEAASESSQPEYVPTEADISQPDEVPSPTTLAPIDYETTGSDDIQKPDDAQETVTGSAHEEHTTPSIIQQGEEDKVPVDDAVTDAPLPEGSGSSSDNEVPQSPQEPVISEDEHGDHHIHTVQPETEKPVMTVEAVEAETSAPHAPETTDAPIAETTILPQAEIDHPPAPVESAEGEEISTGKPSSGSDDQAIIPSTAAPNQPAEPEVAQSGTEISQEDDGIAATTNAPVQQAVEHETDEDIHAQPPSTASPAHPSHESSSPAEVSTESSMKVTEKVDEDQSSEMISGGITGATEAPIPGPEGIPGPSDVEPPHGIIPGEGNCLVEGQTYVNNSVIPPMNPCVLSCRCASSIVHCVKVSCSPPPPGHNCVPVKEKSDSCCETYLCDGNSTPSLESDNHMGVTTPEDGKLPQSSTYPSVEEHPTIVESDEFVPEAVEAEKPEASGTSESAGESQGTVDNEKPYPDEQVPEQSGGTEPIEHPSQPETPISEGDNISQHPEEHPSLENEISSTDAPSVPGHPSTEAEEQKPEQKPQQEDEIAATTQPSAQLPETEAPVESRPSVTSGPVLPVKEELVPTEQPALPESTDASQQATESNLPVEPVVDDTSSAAPAHETDQSSGSEQSVTEELPVQPVEAEQSQPDHEHETPIEHTPEESHTTLSPSDDTQEHVTGVSEDSAVSHPEETTDEITQKPSHEIPDQKPSDDVPGTTESAAVEVPTSQYPSEEHVKPSEGETPAPLPAEPSEAESDSGSAQTEQGPIEQDITENPEIEQTQTSEPGLPEVEQPSATEDEHHAPSITEAGPIAEPSSTDKPQPGGQEPVIIASDELTTLAPESQKPAEEEIISHPLPEEAETTEAEKPPAPGQVEASEADVPESTEKLPVETPAQSPHEEPQSTLAPEEHVPITTSVPDVTIAVEHGDGGHPLEGDSMTLEEENKPSSEKPVQLPVESDSVTEHKPDESESSVTLPPAEVPPPSNEQGPETLPEAEHPQKPSEDVPESTEQSPPEVAQEIEHEAESGTHAPSGQEVEASEEQKPVTGSPVPDIAITESSVSHETQKPIDVQPVEADSSSTDLPQEAEHPLPGVTSVPEHTTLPHAHEETSHIISSDEESLPTTQHPESVTAPSSSVPQASEDTVSESATSLPSLPSEAEDTEGQKPEAPSSGSVDITTLPPALPSENEEDKPAEPSISPDIVTSPPALPSEAESSDVEGQKPEEPSAGSPEEITTSPPALPSEAVTSEAEEQNPEAPSSGSSDSTTLPPALPSEVETSDDHKPDEPSLIPSDTESTPLPALPSEAEEQKPEEPSSGVGITTSAPSLPSETASPEAEGQKPEEQSSVSFDSVTPEAQHPHDIIPTTDSAVEIQTDSVPSQTPGSVEPSVVGEEEQTIHHKPEEQEHVISEDEVTHGTQAPSEQLPSEDHGEPGSVESATQDSTGIQSSSVEPVLAETDSEDGKPAEETQTDEQLPGVSGVDSEHDTSSVTETSSPVEHATIPGEGLDDSSKKPSPHPVPVSPDSSSPPPVDQKPHLPPHPGPDYENFNPDDGWGYPPTSDEDWSEGSFGPGTCRYGGKLYVSAQQIPRDDPCDFCFCFRSDIICLRQSCPPPIPDCHQEPIDGFCCPRYQCEVSTATMMNVSTTTTTTTTTLPPHFLSHAYNGSAVKDGCMVDGKTFKVGEKITAKSTPCLECLCGRSGEMNCNPKECQPEPMLRKMIMAAASRRR